jgi:hypothetical protein
MKALKVTIMLTVLILIALAGIVDAQQTGQRRPAREKWYEMSIKGRVEAIDWQNREMLLRGPDGDLITAIADEQVKRFNEISVGDYVKTTFWTYMKAEFRDPTPEEVQEPLIIISEAERAPKDLPPGAAVGAVVKAVVTIEIINRPDMIVTVKGPRGKYVSIPARDPVLLTQLRIGEVAVITYAEALALTLEKVDIGK